MQARIAKWSIYLDKLVEVRLFKASAKLNRHGVACIVATARHQGYTRQRCLPNDFSQLKIYRDYYYTMVQCIVVGGILIPYT